MDKDMKFLIDRLYNRLDGLDGRLDRLRIELKEDFSGLMEKERGETKELDKRVSKVEKTVNIATGASLIVSFVASWFFKK